ncbi:putative Cation efflux protein [Gammaproteobacteria bacterium]
MQAGWTDLFCTLTQAIFRTILGWVSGSLGLVVQGLYSFGDALAKVVTLVSVQIANRPPSKKFPFGYGKILFVSSLIIGVGLLIGGVSLGLTIFTGVEGVQSVHPMVTIFGIMLSASASEFMYHFMSCVAKENNNSAIKSASLDNRVDAISSVMVLIGNLLSNAGIPTAEKIVAFVIVLMVVRIGVMIAWDAINGLLDVSVSQETLSDMARAVRITQGVHDVKLIRGRSLGEYWEIYLHIALDENITIREGDDIVIHLKKRILANFPKVKHVWVVTVPQESRDNEEDDYWKSHLFSMPRANMVNKPSNPSSVAK